MSRKPLSFWDQMELALLRLLSTVLGTVDGLLKVRWGERLLERLAGRWQSQLTQLREDIARLEKERKQLQLQAEALAIHIAAIYLGGRMLTCQELYFDPSDPRDEEILDASIDLLVKQRLATVETEEIEPRHYIYHLEPDWVAIRARLAQAADQVEPEIADWFHEGLQFIDEVLVSEPGS